MTTNRANTISKHGQMLWRSLSEDLCNSRKLKKGNSDLWNKQASSFQKVDILKNSEKVPYSKSSFYNQLIKYSMFLVSLWAMINTEERTFIASLCVAVLNSLNLIHIVGVQICAPLFCKSVFLQNEPIILTSTLG